MRDEIYAPYAQEYKEKEDIYKGRISTRFTPPQEEFFQALLAQKESLLKLLKAENYDLETQIKQLNQIIKESSISIYEQRLKELKDRLKQNYLETSGDNPWQSWIYKNYWLFAAQYSTPLSKEKIGFDSIPDFLFPTLDGFIDVLEIKLPSSKVISDEDSSHPGSYKWSNDSNIAIGQVINYLDQIEQHQREITERIEDMYSVKLNAMKPRGIILIGQSYDWTRAKRIALRRANNRLHNIEILTYTELVLRGENLIKTYKNGNTI